MIPLRLPLLLAGLLAGASLSAQVVTIDFSSNPNGVSLSGIDGGEVVYGASVGLDGGGGLRGRVTTAPIGNMVAARTVKTTSTFDPAIGAITASVFFQFDPAAISSNNSTLTATDRFAAIGFTTSTSTGAASSSGPTAAGASIYATLGGGRAGTSPDFTYSLQTRAGVRNTVPTNTLAGTSTSAQWAPTTAGWYFWEVTFTHTGGTNWTIDSVISNATASGEVGSIVVSRSSPFTAGPTLADLTGMVGVLQVGENDRMGIAAYDDLTFAVVPEPSAAALLGVLGALALLARRRR